MAIISCPSCGKRISDQYKVCPHCDEVLGDLNPVELKKREQRKRRRQFFRGRMATFVAMTIFLVGLLWWWIDGALMALEIPPPVPAVVLMTLGGALYGVAWFYIFWLRWSKPPG